MALLITSCKQVVREMDLSGEWEVALDSLDKGISEKWYMESFPDKITLPGTLCDAGYGTPCTLEPTMDKEIFLNLKRKFDYLGPAWYKKECFIPAEWNEKEVFLTLERVIWNSQVWINGTKSLYASITGDSMIYQSKTLHMLIRTIPRLCGMASWVK